MSLELSIVLPAYKEAAALSKLLPTLKSRAAELTGAHEILVVDAQQPLDETPAICLAHGVRHIHRRYGNLYGDAIRTGGAIDRGRDRLHIHVGHRGASARLPGGGGMILRSLTGPGA
jgi:glycosyltransferase involved in cell wall biosynthesis